MNTKFSLTNHISILILLTMIFSSCQSSNDGGDDIGKKISYYEGNGGSDSCKEQHERIMSNLSNYLDCTALIPTEEEIRNSMESLELTGSVNSFDVAALTCEQFMVSSAAIDWSLSKGDLEMEMKDQQGMYSMLEDDNPLSSFIPFFADVLRDQEGNAHSICMFSVYLVGNEKTPIPWSPADSGYPQFEKIELADAVDTVDDEFIKDLFLLISDLTIFIFNDDERVATPEDLAVIAKFEEKMAVH